MGQVIVIVIDGGLAAPELGDPDALTSGRRQTFAATGSPSSLTLLQDHPTPTADPLLARNREERSKLTWEDGRRPGHYDLAEAASPSLKCKGR